MLLESSMIGGFGIVKGDRFAEPACNSQKLNIDDNNF